MIANLLTIGQILETIMLVCFGCSWPISILKSWRTKFVRGKSVGFMILVIVGYFAGTGYKLARAAHAGTSPEFTTLLYAVNGMLVMVDLALYCKYRNNHEPVTRQVASDIAEMVKKKPE